MNLFKTTATYRRSKKLSKETIKNIPQPFYSFASLVALAAINYTIIQSPFVILGIFSLIVHELAHYFYARSFGAKVNFPIFIPIPFIAISFVKVKNLLDQYKSTVAISGLIFGSFTIFLFSLFNFYFYLIPFYIILFMFFGEIIFNIIGTDGSKYRRYKNYNNYAHNNTFSNF
jgi:hypothetical protein